MRASLNFLRTVKECTEAKAALLGRPPNISEGLSDFNQGYTIADLNAAKQGNGPLSQTMQFQSSGSTVHPNEYEQSGSTIHPNEYEQSGSDIRSDEYERSPSQLSGEAKTPKET